jgi:serine/threonine protein kinase
MFSAEGYGAPKDPLVGQIIQGRYKIIHAIGKGSMGIVYEAQHLFIGRKVALKTMAAHAASPACVQRFQREAQAAAAVGSSHVVDVLDMGQLENGTFFIVMEHLNGVDLGFAVALEQRFSVGRGVHVLCQLCDALSAIHAAGVVHRDLKPENIFLTTRDGTPDFVKVLDFGVCKFNNADGARLTGTGDTVGTPLFMAPEQVEGRTDCDYRADIYALGAILFFVLTGRAPFDAPNLPSLFVRICKEPAPSLPSTDSGLSTELDAIIQRALSKDPHARFSSCGDFKAALRSLQTTSNEMSASLPGAVHESRLGDDAWGNSTASLVNSLRLRRPRWLGISAVAVGALAVSISSGAYLRRLAGLWSVQAGPSVPSSRPEAGSATSRSAGQSVSSAGALPVEVQPQALSAPYNETPLAAVLLPRKVLRERYSAPAVATSSIAASSLAAAGAPSEGAAAGAASTPQGGSVGIAPPSNVSDGDFHLTPGPKHEP